jgi:RecQ-mediated genome instability protein 1
LEGQHVLQVDEMINIAERRADRSRAATTANQQAKRMLKLSLTDGSQRVFAIEYRSCPALRVPYEPGFKVASHNSIHLHHERNLTFVLIDLHS